MVPDHIPDDTGGLLIGLVVIVAQHPHRIQDAAVHRLQAIAHIRQCATHDDAHGIVKVRLSHLVFEIDGQDFARECCHLVRGLLGQHKG